MELFEICYYDGYGTFTTMVHVEMTFEEARDTLLNMSVGMNRGGVDTGRLELRGEDNKLVELYEFDGAKKRVAQKRAKARRAEFMRKMHEQGLDTDDLMV